MSANSLSSLFETEEVRDLIRQADTDSLALELELSAKFVEDEEKTIPPLRLAAIASITSLLSNTSLDAWLREREQTNLESDNNILTVFVNWNSYISYLITSSLTPDIDDLIYFATSGLLAKRPNEVRDLLRIKKTDKWFGSIAENVAKSDWLTKVRSNISLAILFIIRQQNHQDIKKAGEILKELSDLQKQVEAEWLHNRTNPQRDALKLLGYYNLAQAVLRTSEFLLVGSVEANGRIVNDIAGELRRLLVRAEEFLQLASDSEAMLWLTVVGISLALLRESSIWVQAKGISERIDGLLGELVSMAREQPIFSLLPSQQDAIRQSLLDRSKMVIILQMPTSAGKTLLAEFSIVQTFDAYRGSSKVVYVVPTRALATQVRRILLEDLGPLGIKVSAAGSAFEEDPYELELLLNTDGVVVATPEKLDLLLRAHQEWFKDLRLIVVDEAHLISESERGVRLELLLANIRREQPEARLLLLTPFIENAKEIATWLSRERGISIQIQWRPSKILLGLAMVSNTGKNKNLSISWKDPFNPFLTPKPLSLPVSPSYNKTQSNRERIIFFADIFKKIGSVLAIFSSSPSAAEETAHKVAMECISLPVEKRTPQLRLAIALALKEYGTDSRLAYCLERGVSFHHSSLSPILRYLIEDQVRAKTINFIAATSTLAQGLNFPIATVLVHSVHKPNNSGNFSSAEFWNIAGRAGRVGMIEKGLVIFVNKEHKGHFERYSSSLTNSIKSALLVVLNQLSDDVTLKDQYKKFPALRPFIQYLAHAAANSSISSTIKQLDELIQQSLANQQITNDQEAQKLRSVARNYLLHITGKSKGFLKVADITGLGTFSFDELYSKLNSDPVLKAGPKEVLLEGEKGICSLINALQWLPEIDMALGLGEGRLNVQAIAKSVQGWIEGKQICELASIFSDEDRQNNIRKMATYIYSTVSQNISWGAHAYIRSWFISGENKNTQHEPSESMLPAYIQYGVHTPEAAVASLIGVPRLFAEGFGEEYRNSFGSLYPRDVGTFKLFIEKADRTLWEKVVKRAGLPNIDSEDVRHVFLQMQGISS